MKNIPPNQINNNNNNNDNYENDDTGNTKQSHIDVFQLSP